MDTILAIAGLLAAALAFGVTFKDLSFPGASKLTTRVLLGLLSTLLLVSAYWINQNGKPSGPPQATSSPAPAQKRIADPPLVVPTNVVAGEAGPAAGRDMNGVTIIYNDRPATGAR